jgi:hypothetical protein
VGNNNVQNMNETFQRGWAKIVISQGNKKHYFVRIRLHPNAVMSACGHKVALDNIYTGENSYRRCKTCDAVYGDKGDRNGN